MNYPNLVKASAIYDLVLTAAFAVPVIAGIKIGLLQQLHHHFELAGSFPDFAPLHLFFLNLLGSVVVVWSVLRIRHPEIRYGLYDGVARMLFSLAMAHALFIGQVSDLIWLFLIPELAWGVVQLSGYYKLQAGTQLSGAAN